ncbi:hypothetical protein Q5752_003180 [Cryptotrichosporon argae]
MSAPVRQPRGPPSDPSFGPPPADADSALRRNKTVSAPRHGPSASLSSTPAGAGAGAGAGRFGTGRAYRSGSLSSGSESGAGLAGLVRKGSGREVRTEAAVQEAEAEGTGMESGSWGRGLSRQSSLPSRRGINPGLHVSPNPPVPPLPPRAERERAERDMPPPPRPPRRIHGSVDHGPSPPPSAHAPSHSLSSLAMLTRGYEYESPNLGLGSAGVSRTQSLRAQATKVADPALGRSSSLRTGESHHRVPNMSPPTATNTPGNPFTPPTPPPLSSSAALPPFGLSDDASLGTAEIKRHQSLTQGYGQSSRVRERLERAPHIFVPDARDADTLRRARAGHSRHASEAAVIGLRDDAPLSPIGTSLWSPGAGATAGDGWSSAPQHFQDALDAMTLGRMAGLDLGGPPAETQAGRTSIAADLLRHPPAPAHTNGDEPAWVTNLVGGAGQISPQPVRTAPAATTQGWDRDRPQPQPQLPYVLPWGQVPYLQPGYGVSGGLGGLNIGGLGPNGMKVPMLGHMPYGPYMGGPYPAPTYPTPPGTAALVQHDLDVIELARKKGLNPATFDCRPPAARFFVIKSYTEDDVQKSLKHEIWSSTVLGNKRLDTAFRESADSAPIYLFFSVNGSRHFCGVAQMLTPVDETQTSSVWAQDKWKGIFKVRWIFVRDVPTAALRHIRLINTPERKPITNSRDTQELHYEAGCEVLQIFLEHQTKSKTSLLQDFAYYEQLAASRAGRPPTPSHPAQSASPAPSVPPIPAQHMPPPSAQHMPPQFHATMSMPVPTIGGQLMGVGSVGPPPVPAHALAGRY